MITQAEADEACERACAEAYTKALAKAYAEASVACTKIRKAHEACAEIRKAYDKVKENTSPQAQPAREPLTDGELADLWYKQSLDWMEFARAIEAAHGITKGNT